MENNPDRHLSEAGVIEMYPANHVIFPGVNGPLVAWSVFLIASNSSLIIINNSICGILHEYIAYNSYIIDASRGVMKVITDRTHTPPINEEP